MIFRSPFDTATAVHREHLLRQRAVERVSRADIDQGGWSTLLPLDRAAESWWGLSSLFLLRDGFREGFDDHSPDTVDVAGNGNTRLLIGLCGEPSKPSLCGHGQPGPNARDNFQEKPVSSILPDIAGVLPTFGWNFSKCCILPDIDSDSPSSCSEADSALLWERAKPTAHFTH